MFDCIAPRYDLMNRLMTAGSTVLGGGRLPEPSCDPGIAFSRPLLRDRRSRARRAEEGGDVTAVDFSAPMLEGGLGRSRPRSSGSKQTHCTCPWPTTRSTPSRSASACATWPAPNRDWRRCAVSSRPGTTRNPGRHAPAELLAPFYKVWFDALIPAVEAGSRRSGVHVPPRERPPVPGPRELAELMDEAGFEQIRWALRGRNRRAAHRSGPVSARTPRAVPGLEAYLAEVETQLEQAVGRYPGLVADAGSEALSGGKRLRPLLVFLAAPLGRPPPVAAAVSIELVPWRPSCDDLIDGASLRHGRPAVWSVHGDQAAVTTGDYLFARARRAGHDRGRRRPGDPRGGSGCPFARRGAQRRQAYDPDTTIESYLERCALKTGKLFEAACGSPR